MIEVKDVHKSFGSQKVLRGASLRIEQGEAVVIIGRSGGGKSILLKHIIGLLRPDSGSVLFDGHDLACMDERPYLQDLIEYMQGSGLRYPEDLGRLARFSLRAQTLDLETHVFQSAGHEEIELHRLVGGQLVPVFAHEGIKVLGPESGLNRLELVRRARWQH